MRALALTALALILVGLGCQPGEPQFPRWATFDHAVHHHPDSTLWRYELVMGRTAPHQVLAIKERARAAGQTAWAEDCVWIYTMVPQTSQLYASELPWWDGVAKDVPMVAIYQAVCHNPQWLLRDTEGRPIQVWGPAEAPHYLLNLGPDCPPGTWSHTAGLSYAEWSESYWVELLEGKRGSRFRQAFDGAQWEDGPFPVIRWWECEGRLIVPGPGKEPMTPVAFRDYAWPRCKLWLERTAGRLSEGRLLTRANGHHYRAVCPRHYAPLDSLIPQLFWSAKLEHLGNWGGCPQDNVEKWMACWAYVEDAYHPLTLEEPQGRLDLIQGWDVGSVTCGVPRGPLDEVYRWERLVGGIALMGDGTLSVAWRDAQYQALDDPVPIAPSLRRSLGRPLGPYTVKLAPDSDLEVYVRAFEKATVVVNPNPQAVLDFPGRDATWIWKEAK